MAEIQKFLHVCSNHQKVRKQFFTKKLTPYTPQWSKVAETQNINHICLNHQKVRKTFFDQKIYPPIHPPKT